MGDRSFIVIERYLECSSQPQVSNNASYSQDPEASVANSSNGVPQYHEVQPPLQILSKLMVRWSWWWTFLCFLRRSINGCPRHMTLQLWFRCYLGPPGQSQKTDTPTRPPPGQCQKTHIPLPPWTKSRGWYTWYMCGHCLKVVLLRKEFSGRTTLQAWFWMPTRYSRVFPMQTFWSSQSTKRDCSHSSFSICRLSWPATVSI